MVGANRATIGMWELGRHFPVPRYLLPLFQSLGIDDEVGLAAWRDQRRPLVRGRKPKQSCSVEGCGGERRTRGMCKKHYKTYRRIGDPRAGPVTPCSVEGCGRAAWVRGMCSFHYQRYRFHGDPLLGGRKPKQSIPCSVEGCGRTALTQGMCGLHYQRYKRNGDLVNRRPKPSGPCSAEGCGRAAGVRGMCGLHYQRWWKHGDFVKRSTSRNCRDGCTCGRHRRRPVVLRATLSL